MPHSASSGSGLGASLAALALEDALADATAVLEAEARASAVRAAEGRADVAGGAALLDADPDVAPPPEEHAATTANAANHGKRRRPGEVMAGIIARRVAGIARTETHLMIGEQARYPPPRRQAR